MITRDSKNIIIADDSVFFRTKLSDILTEAGHKITFARDGKELIAKIQTDIKTLNLILLDMQMPIVDGFGVLTWINENGLAGKFPVLVVTGAFEAMAVVTKLRGLGASGFMTKTATPEQIIFRVNHLLFPNKQSHRSPFERVPVSMPVDFTEGTGAMQSGFIQNIAEGGTFLHTDARVRIGTKLQLKFLLPGLTKLFNLSATVEWSTYDNPGDKSLFGGYGMKFAALTEEERGILREFIKDEMNKPIYNKL